MIDMGTLFKLRPVAGSGLKKMAFGKKKKVKEIFETQFWTVMLITFIDYI